VNLIYFGMHPIQYGQVGIWDCEDKAAYPETEGALPWWGPKGLVVPACSDTKLPVYVFTKDHHPNPPPGTPNFLTSNHIEVGKEGLEIGNIMTASVDRIDWPPGRTFLTACYSGEAPYFADRISFLLTQSQY